MDIAVEHIALNEIKPYEKNAKNHPAKQITALAKQIEAHGFDVPIVVDENGVILKGHGRFKAATQLGLPTVPIIRRYGLTDAQKKAVRIADNKLAETSWDMDALVPELKSIKASDFDFVLTGFDKVPQLLANIEAPVNVSSGYTYNVMVECEDEDAQSELLTRLEGEGYKCRLLIS